MADVASSYVQLHACEAAAVDTLMPTGKPKPFLNSRERIVERYLAGPQCLPDLLCTRV